MSAPANQVKTSNSVESETVIAATDVQDRLGDVMDRAFGGERFRVTRHGRDRVYIVGASDYERLRDLERAAKKKRGAAA